MTKITVAALMTADWIARRLEVPPGVTRIMIPGMCQGDPAVLTEQFDVPAEKGPADLKRLPAFFGQADARSRYGARDIQVFAEINNVPRLDRERIVERASYYRDAGADVIDLGLSLDRTWLDEGPEVIADLKARGFTLSIDTLDPDEILMADAAGVDYVLSLNGDNRDIAEHLRATPVLILTARGQWEERVEGIEAGADDYVVKPFRVEEVIARVRAIVRRSNGLASSRIPFGDLVLDVADRLLNTLAQVAALVAVAQLDRFERAGGGAGRDRGAADRAVVQPDLDLDGRVAPRVEDLAGADVGDRAHAFSVSLAWSK